MEQSLPQSTVSGTEPVSGYCHGHSTAENHMQKRGESGCREVAIKVTTLMQDTHKYG